MKCLGINVTKYVQDLYEENHKTLMKKLKDLIRWKDNPCSWLGKLNIKMSFLPNVIYRFHIIPMEIPSSYFVDIEKLILKCYGKAKDPEYPILKKKKNKIKRLTLLDFKAY